MTDEREMPSTSPSPRRRGRPWLIGLALVGLIVAGAVTRGPALVRHVQRRRALSKAIAALVAKRTDAGWREEPAEAAALVAFDEPEALVALLESYRASFGARRSVGPPEPSGEDPRSLLRAVELFAIEPEPKDTLPRELLEGMAREGPAEQQFWAYYFLEELDHPRQAREPEGFASRDARVSCAPDAVVEAVRAQTTYQIDFGDTISVPRVSARFSGGRASKRISSNAISSEPTPGEVPLVLVEDTPWRALTRHAQEAKSRLAVEGREVRSVPDGHVVDASEYWDSSGARGAFQFDAANTPSSFCVGSFGAVAEAPLHFAHGLRSTGYADPEKAIRALARLSHLEPRRSGPDEILALGLDRRAILAPLVEAVRPGGNHELTQDHSWRALRFALLGFDEPEALDALLESYATVPKRERISFWAEVQDPIDDGLVLDAGALFAATSTPSESVRARVAALVKSGDRRQRLVGLALESELREPSLPHGPDSLVHGGPVVVPAGSLGDAVAALSSQIGVAISCPGADRARPVETFIARPWRALLRLALVAGRGGVCRVQSLARAVTLEVGPRDLAGVAWRDPDGAPGVSASVRELLRKRPFDGEVSNPRRALEALAALENGDLRESASGELTFEPRAPK